MVTIASKSNTEPADLMALKGHLPLIGLTGGIGSGKTTVSDLLKGLGAGIIDTDLIAHQITAPGGIAIPLIEKEFGQDYLEPYGALNRAKMRALVFAQPEARKRLEQITHPLIRQETIKEALKSAKSGAPYLVFVVPLLIESTSWQGLLDHIAVVDCPEETQIDRVMQRNKLSRAEVLQILGAQAKRQDRIAQADTVLHNHGDLEALSAEVHDLHQKIVGITKV